MTNATASLAELFEDTPEELRRQALSHSSWVEKRTESYGRLAFLGDSVLAYAVLDVVEASAMDAMQSMHTYLMTRPTGFTSLSQGIEWQ